MLHSVVEDHIEELLAGRETPAARAHLEVCEPCRQMLATMGRQSRWIRTLKSSEEAEPAPGFYARVMERIEAEGPISVWNLFMESAFGRRIAVASFALAVLMGVYLVTIENDGEAQIMAVRPSIPFTLPDENIPAFVSEQAIQPVTALDPLDSQVPGFASLSGFEFDQVDPDAVLVDLATYREQ